jgi:hypothetical protein
MILSNNGDLNAWRSYAPSAQEICAHAWICFDDEISHHVWICFDDACRLSTARYHHRGISSHRCVHLLFLNIQYRTSYILYPQNKNIHPKFKRTIILIVVYVNQFQVQMGVYDCDRHHYAIYFICEYSYLELHQTTKNSCLWRIL